MDEYSNAGSFWWAFAIIGFFIAYGLRKAGLLSTEKSQTIFATWGSAIVAGIFALLADTSSAVSEFFGRIVIFALVWFLVGIVLTIGIQFGVEKAEKK